MEFSVSEVLVHAVEDRDLTVIWCRIESNRVVVDATSSSSVHKQKMRYVDIPISATQSELRATSAILIQLRRPYR
jgi:hypothetical protein